MTGKRVSTLTPESSEAPRESVAGEVLYGGPAAGGMSEEQLMLDDALATGNGFMLDGKRVDPALVRVASLTGSPELASLAAKYVNMSDNELWIAITGKRELRYDQDEGPAICADIRRLAASVLAQAEGTPRK